MEFDLLASKKLMESGTQILIHIGEGWFDKIDNGELVSLK